MKDSLAVYLNLGAVYMLIGAMYFDNDKPKEGILWGLIGIAVIISALWP